MEQISAIALTATLGIALSGCASPFPVTDTASAIALAKKACAKAIAGDGPVVWIATQFNGTWTVASSTAKDGPPQMQWFVEIPVNGPKSGTCQPGFIS